MAGAMAQMALRLRNANPEAFEGFVNELERFANEQVLATVDADASVVLISQGRAQAALKLLRVLRECHLTKPTP